MMTIKPTTGPVSGRAMAALLGVATAVLLTGGCSSGGGHNDRAAKSPSTAASVPSDSTGKDADKVPPGPKVPEPELTPATGSFTKKQKGYLTDRVPKGVDPAAILEAGQDTCDRIARTAEHDRKAAVDAIRSGEISGARDAINKLCPEYKSLLEAAGKESKG
ncbi:hypothetical protein [Streptomyces sp. AK02-04a]|uniref:hypothetical protein n=1 Tax=Streptomyces sp. AK02-04a TaxID=3028649 RepID=UPI0029AB2336|nr:hypothetical protein [Streptomyces sp. AK02-04a]MDX3763035.1 hypothetical protein [Streptomyces sp. AK02-04a]